MSTGLGSSLPPSELLLFISKKIKSLIVQKMKMTTFSYFEKRLKENRIKTKDVFS